LRVKGTLLKLAEGIDILSSHKKGSSVVPKM